MPAGRGEGAECGTEEDGVAALSVVLLLRPMRGEGLGPRIQV